MPLPARLCYIGPRLREWAKFPRLRKVFTSADWVKPYVIFDIAGNKYRLIAEINFRSQTLFIRHILTHQEYAKGKWKKR